MDASAPRAVSFSPFLTAYPSYNTTGVLDELRAREYSRLDAQRHTYLDYTAGSLYATSQLERHMALLREDVFGNPHSTNPTSSMTMQLVGQPATMGSRVVADGRTPRRSRTGVR